MIDVRQCRKVYRADTTREPLVVLDGVDLHVSEGEVVAVLGPSGCGKTTLLRIVAGLASWEGGEVRVGGAPVTGPGRDRAMVFQDFALLPWATVSENIAFGLSLRGASAAERHDAVHRLVGMIGLRGFEDRYPSQLSGGMQQRVGLARALAVEPRVLLLDEPFGSLDSITRRGLQDDLLALHQETGKTVLLVTHSVDEAARLADRIVLLSPRPARVLDVIDTGLPRPRPAHLERDARFAALKDDLWERLKQPSAR